MSEELVTVCAGMQIRWNSACHGVARILKCSIIFFHGVTTCYDETVVPLSCYFRKQFVNYEQTRRNYWVADWSGRLYHVCVWQRRLGLVTSHLLPCAAECSTLIRLFHDMRCKWQSLGVVARLLTCLDRNLFGRTPTPRSLWGYAVSNGQSKAVGY